MDWQEEMLWTVLGVIPGAFIISTGGRALRKGEITPSDVGLSLGASAASSLAIARWGSPALKEMAQYMTYRGFINMKKSADTGRIVYAAGPRLLAYSSMAAVPTGMAATAAYHYELEVNEPIRETTGGTQGVWHGPFASGFGTVV